MTVSVASAPRTTAAPADDPLSSTASWEGPLCNNTTKRQQLVHTTHSAEATAAIGTDDVKSNKFCMMHPRLWKSTLFAHNHTW